MCSADTGATRDGAAPIVKICLKGKCTKKIQTLYCDKNSDEKFAYVTGLEIHRVKLSTSNLNDGTYRTDRARLSVKIGEKRIPKSDWRSLSCREIKRYGSSCLDFSGDLSTLSE